LRPRPVTSSLFLTALAPNAAALQHRQEDRQYRVGWSQWFIGFAPLGFPAAAGAAAGYVICRPRGEGES
jgi:citrate:succinate antiporter/L-tartrate/succinate antiporter